MNYSRILTETLCMFWYSQKAYNIMPPSSSVARNFTTSGYSLLVCTCEQDSARKLFSTARRPWPNSSKIYCINNAYPSSCPFHVNVGLLMRQIQLVHMNKLLPVFYQVHSSFTVLAVDLLVRQIQLVHMTKFLVCFFAKYIPHLPWLWSC